MLGKNLKPWKQYVPNRVNDNLSKSNREEWFYCPGILNPADLPSRRNYKDINNNSLWWEGPEFLKSQPNEWPKSPSGDELETETAMNESAKSDPQIIRSMLVSSNKPTVSIDKVVEMP